MTRDRRMSADQVETILRWLVERGDRLRANRTGSFSIPHQPLAQIA
jgi:hypothetical protein